ncbi:MAG: class I SAM-dependent methyltransferase [Chloroflexota bacterium]
MNQSSPEKPAVSTTAQISPDAMGLGRTVGQRTAEMVAGLRYELDKSPVNNALSRFAGRLIARLMITVLHDKSQVNYILARPAAFNQLIRQYITANTPTATLVEIAAGFSPRGFELAQTMPNLQVIEIDLPDVVEEKRRRLTKAPNIKVPPNLKWYKADLGAESLNDVLQGEKVDIVCAEGLNPYFSHEDITRIAGHVRESLKPGGVYISDIGWDEARKTSEQSSMGIFSRNASAFLGIIKIEEEGRQLLLNAGYNEVEIHKPTQITADMKDIPKTPLDYSIIFIAHNPKSSTPEAETPVKSMDELPPPPPTV